MPLQVLPVPERVSGPTPLLLRTPAPLIAPEKVSEALIFPVVAWFCYQELRRFTGPPAEGSAWGFAPTVPRSCRGRDRAIARPGKCGF